MGRKRRTARRRRGLAALLIALIALLGWQLRFLFPGLVPGGGAEPDRERTERAPRGARDLRFAVLDPDTLSPVEGAVIRVFWSDGRTTDVATDAAGEARLARPVPSDRAAWTALAPGDAPRRARIAAPVPVRLELRDAQGEPLDATVKVDGRGHRSGPTGSTRLPAPPAEPGPDASGLRLEPGPRVGGTLVGLGPGTLEVYALAPAPGRDGLVHLESGWEVDADGRYAGRLPAGAQAWGLWQGRPFPLERGPDALPPAATARGRVVGPDGAPVAGARVVFSPQLDPVWQADRPARAVVTDPGGSFVLEGLGAVDHRVTVAADGLATRIFEEVRPGGGPKTFALEAGFALSGVVVDPEGRPWPGVRVRARGVPDPDWQRPRAETTTDAQGGWTLAGLGGGNAETWVHAPGREPHFAGPLAPGGPHRIELPFPAPR